MNKPKKTQLSKLMDKAEKNPGKTFRGKGVAAREGTTPGGRSYSYTKSKTGSTTGVYTTKDKYQSSTSFYKDKGSHAGPKGGVRKVVSKPEGKLGFQRNRRIKKGPDTPAK